MYEGLHHVSVAVTNLERSKTFYGEVLGFKESTERPDFGVPGAWYQIGTTQVHLVQWVDGKTLRGTTEIDIADGHFAIRVSDMDAFIRRLETYNVKMLNMPVNKTQWHQVYISDPDGNLIEFNR